MILYVARDIVFNDLYLYDKEPIRDERNACFINHPDSKQAPIHLNDDAFWFFKDITWENSPKAVELNIK